MADEIFEMKRSVGCRRYTWPAETDDNENLDYQTSETAAIGDAEKAEADCVARGVGSSVLPRSQGASKSPNPSSTR